MPGRQMPDAPSDGAGHDGQLTIRN